MSTRPSIELALDVRSYESIVVLSDPEASQYPSHWTRPATRDIRTVDSHSVVLVDRVDLSRKTLATVGELYPRLIAFAPDGVEQEKSMRRLVTATYPWAETWTVSTSFGKLLVVAGAQGPAYDRNDVADMRSAGAA